MESSSTKILDSFKEQLDKVLNIIEFDREYLQIAIDQLERHKDELVKFGLENKRYHPDSQINLLKTLVRSGPSQSKYQPVFNQCLVLQVSHFASAISSTFNESLSHYLENPTLISEKAENLEFRFRLSELIELEYDLSTAIGQIIARKSDISFQDMKSITNAFETFFSVEIKKNVDVDNIIAAQALRHVIVHNGEVVDQKCLRQLQSAGKRNFYRNIKIRSKIAIQREHIETVQKSMLSYVDNLIALCSPRVPQT